MGEVVLDEATDFKDDFSVMYSADEVFKCSCGGTLIIGEPIRSIECDTCGGTDYQAESYADFFTQMEELLESTTIAGGWTLDATTDQEDPDAVTMVVKFKPSDPSTFFDIIE